MTKRFLGYTVILLTVVLIVLCCSACGNSDTSLYREKADLLKAEVLSEQTAWELGVDPSGPAGYTVFLSVCNGEECADVLSATADTLEAAWNEVDEAAEKQKRAALAQDRCGLYLRQHHV